MEYIKTKLIREPIFWIAVGSLILAIAAGIIAGAKTEQPPRVVKEFCREFEKLEGFEKEDIKRLSEMGRISSTMMGTVSDIWDPQTQKIKCHIGATYEEQEGVTVVPIDVVVYEKGKMVDSFCLHILLKDEEGNETIDSVNFGTYTLETTIIKTQY